jgi:hypothetical protein
MFSLVECVGGWKCLSQTCVASLGLKFENSNLWVEVQNIQFMSLGLTRAHKCSSTFGFSGFRVWILKVKI